VWQPNWPCPVPQILGLHRRGGADPTYRIESDHSHWRGIRTPLGIATLRVQVVQNEVIADAWGVGAEWLLEQLPAMLGDSDNWTGWEPRHPVVGQVRQQFPHWRLGSSQRVLEALVPAIIEQKVTGQEAFKGFRNLVRRHGEPAPGPHPDLWVQPEPQVIAAIPSWDWLKMHIDPARSRTLIYACQRASTLERIGHEHPDDLDRALRTLPGIGEWTSAEVRQRALGDPDAVPFGDYHVAKDVTWALTGKIGDDDTLREILEPWRPHRGRVPALLSLAGHHRPRRGPRMAPRLHLPAR
jgi:3-methyladenine DNA glycosylase/8-oxoguanine DNA glycosylase